MSPYRSFLIFLFISFWFTAVQCTAKDYGKVSVSKVAEGVYLFTTSPYGDVGLSGNCVAVVLKDSVVVFDSTGLPATAEIILTELRKVTNEPVRYLINSHWHWDHWQGNETFQSAYPAIQIIAHEKTVEQMKEVEPRWNGEGVRVHLPAYVQSLEKKLADARTNKAPEAELRDLEDLLKIDSSFLAQKANLRKTLPNLSFSDSLTIDSPDRKVQIHHAKAITAGDAYLFLPGEKILITGDILLHPYPYAIGGTYPAEWLKVLQEFAAMEPAIVIPGHGPAQNSEFLKKNISLFEEVLKRVRELRSAGSTLEQTKQTIGKDNTALAAMLDITDAEKVKEFQSYFLDIFVSRAYREIEEPLSDLPDGLS